MFVAGHRTVALTIKDTTMAEWQKVTSFSSEDVTHFAAMLTDISATRDDNPKKNKKISKQKVFPIPTADATHTRSQTNHESNVLNSCNKNFTNDDEAIRNMVKYHIIFRFVS